MPPREWGVGAHAKHLRNLYVYFWRWATWKVYDHGPGSKSGIVCFITVAGFLNGPGFEKMRDYLRRTCDDIWVIDCSPEGHQPEVNTRIFQGVQQPVCIVLASRSSVAKSHDAPANVLFRALPRAPRDGKFEALAKLTLKDKDWIACPNKWRAPFLPESVGAWATYPRLEDLFIYNGSGVMPGRTWIIAPDVGSLEKRWKKLIGAKAEEKETLFHPHIRNGALGDKHSQKKVSVPLHELPARAQAVADDQGDCVSPTAYAFRSFDRQFIIPDSRLINQPNPELWNIRSDYQIHITALTRTSPSNGPAITLTDLVPDLDHYKGSFGGRVFPLWLDEKGTKDNFRPALRLALAKRYGHTVAAQDLFAYIAAVVANPAFTRRFQKDLSTPGLHVPITADPKLFAVAAELGRTVIWLHTFGERMVDDKRGRPSGPPRIDSTKRPYIPIGGEIASDKNSMPDSLEYDAGKHRLHIGTGYVENVPPAVWSYEVSGKQVLVQWFSYRRKNRERPIIGDRRPPSPLGDIQPDHWLPEYTTELINVLNVLAMLVELEPKQAGLLEKICAGPLISRDDLEAAGAFALPPKPKKTKKKASGTKHMFE